MGSGMSGPLLISVGVNERDDQRLMVWSTPNLHMGGRRSNIPLADLREARFHPWGGGGNALPPDRLAHLRAAPDLSRRERT